LSATITESLFNHFNVIGAQSCRIQ